MLAGILHGLKPDGRFVIVDYYRRKGAMGPGDQALHHIRLDMDDVIKEVEANGFHLVSSKEHSPGRQYIAIFSR
jgi:predicted methyltransferase